jgi:uncharacterized repeat protein (TIGR01451 family)
MKFGVCNLVVATGVLLLGSGGTLRVAPKAEKPSVASVAQVGQARPRAVEGYGKLPLSFEVNQGQTDGPVKFLARGQGYTLFLTSQEAVLSLQKFEGSGRQDGKLEKPGSELIAHHYAVFNDRSPMTTERVERSDALRVTNTMLQMKLVGASAKARVKGMEELPGKSNYFIGNDPKKWRTNIPTYAKVRMENVYPGVDLVYYGNQGQLEYDFVVHPGADPSGIKLALRSTPTSEDAAGSENSPHAKIERKGDLLVHVDGGEVRFRKPVVYQTVYADNTQGKAHRILVNGNYVLTAKSEVTFAVGEYDRTMPLVIDPALAYSSYLGGSQQEQGYAIAADRSGNAYVTGYTISKDFPTSDAPQASNNSSFLYGANAFVTKFNADGSALLYSTYLGGSGTAFAYGVAVDTSGNAYITGQTDSTDFPTVRPFQATYAGAQDSFVTKLNAAGSALVYSTYLGGSGNDEAYGIAVDASGSAYVTGWTSSTNFPTTSGAFQTTNHAIAPYGANAFVTKFSTDGSTLVYSTYLGGSTPGVGDVGAGIAVDASGSAYVTGRVASADFPTVNAFQSSTKGDGTAFVTKLNADGSALVYSTFLGGSSHLYNGMLVGGSVATGIAVDSSGNAYVTGSTYCTDFPTTPVAYQGSNHATGAGSINAFVTKFNPSGSSLVYSTYLGGSNADQANGIAIDGSGDTYVSGYTVDTDFPTANPIQANNASKTAGRNAFITEFNADGSGLVYSTYLGGSANDTAYGIAVDGSNNAYVTGGSGSADFPATTNAFQTTKRSQSYSVFVAKIRSSANLTISNSAPAVTLSGSAVTYTITVFNNGPDTAFNVAITDAIPAGTTFVSVASSSGSCTAPPVGGTGTVTCTVPSVGMNSGDTVVETLVVNVTATSGSSILDTATVSSSTFDPKTADNSATASTSVM